MTSVCRKLFGLVCGSHGIFLTISEGQHHLCRACLIARCFLTLSIHELTPGTFLKHTHPKALLPSPQHPTAQTQKSGVSLNPQKSCLSMEGEASFAEISSFLIFQKPKAQLEDMQYKGRIGASQAEQHGKMCKLAAQRIQLNCRRGILQSPRPDEIIGLRAKGPWTHLASTEDQGSEGL